MIVVGILLSLQHQKPAKHPFYMCAYMFFVTDDEFWFIFFNVINLHVFAHHINSPYHSHIYLIFDKK